MRARKILHIAANNRNIGDELSADGIHHLLAPTLSSNVDYRRIYYETSRFRKQFQEEAKDADLIIVGGGGLLINFFDYLWATVLESEKPFVVWGVGRCENNALRDNGVMDKGLIREIRDKALLISVRDVWTESLLGNTGKEEVISCPSHVAVLNEPKRRSFSAPHGSLLVLHGDLVTPERAASIIAEMELMKLGPVEVYSNLSDGVPGSAIREYYESKRMVVTTRLHGAIIGLTLGIPTIGVESGDLKLYHYFSSLGVPWFCARHDSELEHMIQEMKMIGFPVKVIQSHIGISVYNQHRFAARVAGELSRL